MSEIPNKIWSDLIEENTLSEDFTGFSATRKFILQSVQGNSTQRTYNALQDQRIPKMKQAHPSIPDIKVTSRNAAVSNTDPNIMVVTIQYGVLPEEESTLEAPVFNLGTTSTTEETNFAYGKNNPKSPNSTVVMTNKKEKMIVSHTYPSQLGGQTVKVVPKIQREFPSAVVTIPRTINVSPWPVKSKYEGTVNRGTFFGTGPRTWLCSRVSASTQDGGTTWQTEIEFQYKADTWDTTLFFEDPDSGKVPDDAKAHVFAPYPDEDFQGLAVPQVL